MQPTQRILWQLVLQCLFVVIVLSCVADCGRAGGKVARRASAAVRSRIRNVAIRDAVRDRSTPIVVLGSERKVFRYTTQHTATREARKGFSAGTHFTSRVQSGRPASASSASRRYGLPQRPDRRLTITLPKGARVRFNKALAGSPGVGEITNVEPLRHGRIDRLVRLKK
jgi:hypothetical protein